MSERALVIGRFQPPHKGHFTIFEAMDKARDVEEIIIGIGSSQYHHLLNNPFTFAEREQMLRASLKVNKPFQIVAIPDINNYPRWVAHIESLCPHFSIVYSGNPIVQKLFTEKNYLVRPVETQYKINATKIREMMIAGKNWQKHLPQEIAETITKLRGAERLKEIYCAHLRPGVAADLIIDYQGRGIVLIQRHQGYNNIEGGKWALPGGHLETGQESIIEAAIRETAEETSLHLTPEKLELFNQYSSPGRDPRQHMVSLVFCTQVLGGNLQAGDDAQDIRVFSWDELPENLAFDHQKIIQDYLCKRRLKNI